MPVPKVAKALSKDCRGISDAFERVVAIRIYRAVYNWVVLVTGHDNPKALLSLVIREVAVLIEHKSPQVDIRNLHVRKRGFSRHVESKMILEVQATFS